MKPLIVANWKCNPLILAKTKRLFNSVKKGITKTRGVEVVICPPFIYLETSKNLQTKKIKLGAQDCFWEEKGAFTGEISPPMLKKLGCEYVIVGHSERRKYFKETDEMINKKIKVALDAKLKPILCVGETQKEKKRKQEVRVLNSQISRGFKGIGAQKAKNVIVAYEPVWAIGTGQACDTDTVLTRVLLMRSLFKKRYSAVISKRIRILYGGSVNSENAVSFIKEAQTNGLLIGGASLRPKEFIQIVKNVSKT